MATNYTLAEAAKIVREGTNIEAIQEIGKRFPLLFASLIKVTTKAGKDFDDFIDCMPDYLTANKMNTYIKAKVSDEDEGDKAAEDNTADEDDKPAKKSEKKQTKATKAKEEDDGDEDDDESDSDYDSMTTKDLWVLVKSRPEAKKFIKGNARKDELIAALKKADAEGGASDEDDDADEDEDSYEGMSALELFKECKKRGIKATPKKKEKYYIDLLKKDDASKAEEAEEEDDDDDWDDEPEEEVKPAKKDKKADKKSKAKPKKEEPEDDDDDDDDWDI